MSFNSPKNRKAEIYYKRKCDVGASKNAEQAFSTKRLSSHYIIYEISAFRLFSSISVYFPGTTICIACGMILIFTGKPSGNSSPS